MKKILFGLILLIILPRLLFSTNIDSLKSLINSNTPYSVKSDALTDLIKIYLKNGDEKAIALAMDKLELAKRKADFGGIAKAYEFIAYFYQINENYEQSLENYLYSIHYYNITNDTLGVISACNNIAYNYYKVELPDKSIQYSEKALNYLQHKPDKEYFSNCYINLSKAYRLKGRTKEEIEYIKKSDSSNVRYNNLVGTAFWKLAMFEEAEKYYNKALKNAAARMDTTAIVRSYNDLGINYYSKEQYSKAIELHEKAIVLDPRCSKSYLELSNALFKVGKVAAAEVNLKKAIDLKENPQEVIEVCLQLKEHFKKSGDLQKALRYSEKITELQEVVNKKTKLNYEFVYRSKFKMEEVEKRFNSNKTLIKRETDAKAAGILHYKGILILGILLALLLIFFYFLVRHRRGRKNAFK